MRVNAVENKIILMQSQPVFICALFKKNVERDHKYYFCCASSRLLKNKVPRARAKKPRLAPAFERETKGGQSLTSNIA
jgi:hypothetical protein